MIHSAGQQSTVHDQYTSGGLLRSAFFGNGGQMKRFSATICASLILLVPMLQAVAPKPLARAQSSASPTNISASNLDTEIREFLDREFAAHVGDIKNSDPPQDRVVGALTTGEFSWGTFMRALAAYSELSGKKTVAGHDVAALIGKMGLIEARQGGKTFAQLYAALALRHFGTDLSQNAVWQSLAPEEKDAWRSLLDPARFYDRRKHEVINLPENYFGVASRVAAISFQLGVVKDRSYVDEILDRAAQQFTSGALFADDAVPDGRYDRYSQEYARYVYDAAEVVGRRDILSALAPTLKTQMQLWWDLLAPDGYGYPWGRSLGAIGYMDTLEIVAFLAQHPEFCPAPLSQLAAAYYAAWRWLRNDFNDHTHLLSVFAFGRGNYSYINKEREWQQTTAFLGKMIGAHLAFIPILQKEGIANFPAVPQLGDVARFEFFRHGARPEGVWLVRQGLMRFALPITTGPKGGISDYLPAPHGLPGFAAPVEVAYPALVPYLELDDGRVIVTSDGADQISPSPDGRFLTVTWKHWAIAGGKAAALVDPGVSATVHWELEANHLRRIETLKSEKVVHIRRWWTAMPTSAEDATVRTVSGTRVDRFQSREATLDFQISHSDWPIEIQLRATGDSVLGRSARGPIPLLLVLAARSIVLNPANPLAWECEITVAPPEKNDDKAFTPVPLSPAEVKH